MHPVRAPAYGRIAALIPTRTVATEFARLRAYVQRRPNRPGVIPATVRNTDPWPWGGAGVAFVTLRPPPEPVAKEWDFRYPPRFIVSPHAFAVARLLFRIAPLIGTWAYAGNKYAFYGSMGDAVDGVTGIDANASERTTLTAVLDAAESMIGPEAKGCPVPFFRSPSSERRVERPWADARIVTFHDVDRYDGARQRSPFGSTFSRRFARREIVELRTYQVGEAAATASLRAGRIGKFIVADNLTEVRFGFVPSESEPEFEVFEQNMIALAQDVADRLGQREVELWLDGGLIRASRFGDPPPPDRTVTAAVGKLL